MLWKFWYAPIDKQAKNQSPPKWPIGLQVAASHRLLPAFGMLAPLPLIVLWIPPPSCFLWNMLAMLLPWMLCSFGLFPRPLFSNIFKWLAALTPSVSWFRLHLNKAFLIWLPKKGSYLPSLEIPSTWLAFFAPWPFTPINILYNLPNLPLHCPWDKVLECFLHCFPRVQDST